MGSGASPVLNVFFEGGVCLPHQCEFSMLYFSNGLHTSSRVVSSLSSKTVGLLHHQRGVKAIMAPMLYYG